ncbi:hypothetical protein SETIT_7G234400v2 [Setaria italica]|uniref:Uncharacterized protein n=1 Tax=Setaria italica TaxID=4555 RepID=A0A368RYY7_SETIT|nr:hypothetical protein SETIT_7G234400v2 [Setaria italica]
MDVMPTTTKEEEVRTLDSISETVAVEDLTNKLDAMPSQPSKAKEYEELSMEHTLLQVVASSEDGAVVDTARQSITKDHVLLIFKEAVVVATPLAMTTIGCEDMITERMTQQVDTSFEDIVVVEDAYDDEEIVSEVKVEEARLTEDPSLEVVSSPDTTSINGEYL